MVLITGVEDLKERVGQELGVSDWLLIDQARINAFADATGDHQWIHVDEERAAKSFFGSTIAHGFLILSLFPHLMSQIWQVDNVKMGVNYGSNKIRFTSPVPVNSKIRIRVELTSLENVPNGVQICLTATFEVEGKNKPACIAESLSRLYF